MDVEITEMPELRVTGVYHVGPHMQISAPTCTLPVA